MRWSNNPLAQAIARVADRPLGRVELSAPATPPGFLIVRLVWAAESSELPGSLFRKDPTALRLDVPWTVAEVDWNRTGRVNQPPRLPGAVPTGRGARAGCAAPARVAGRVRLRFFGPAPRASAPGGNP